MSNPWFRMYAEFATDAKVQSMSEPMQRRLMMLFCLRCSDVTVTLSDEELAFQLRISDEELAATKALFLRKGFIDESWEITNWDKRQFSSDSSAERTRAYRARKKEQQNNAETSQLRHSDGLDTDSNTDTDTEKKKAKKSPAQPAVVLPDWIPADAWAGYIEMRKKKRKEPTARAIALLIADLERFRADGYDLAAVLDKSTVNGWTDIYVPKVDPQPRGSPAKPEKFDPVAHVNRNKVNSNASDSNVIDGAIFEVVPAYPGP
jgi:hypothetical protein